MLADYKLIAKAKLPVFFAGGVQVDILSFVRESPEDEATALIHKKNNDSTIPVVRIHSACITGEVFGSLKCDCGYQLNHAMEQICSSGFGILIYLNRHEGRGIGLPNKVRAYALQDQGYNTIEANTMLGLSIDARDFTAAAFILKYLEISHIKIMTNNPNKIAILEQHGLIVADRIPMKSPINNHNKDYLSTKRCLMGHLLDMPEKECS